MNRVGEEGKGESVWLGWFLHATLAAFAPLAEARGEAARAAGWRAHAKQLAVALERNAWDGDWYRRGWFDDGTPLGSAASSECRIDAIAQSWAVLSGAADPDRARRAMAAVDEQLVRRDDGLVLLFTPPFDRAAVDPGYIKGYPPGVRENGGQYTHGAIWTAMAFALMGENEKAWELFALLNPIHHGATPTQIATYKVEPYVLAADVYAVAPHQGRGGWTWYTGAAGWMYRLLIETLLGLNLEGDQLRLTPRLPQTWTTFKIHYRYRQTPYHLTLTRLAAGLPGASQISLDGQDLPGKTIPLRDDRRDHAVVMKIR
jgi:cellobiose phosphorylase